MLSVCDVEFGYTRRRPVIRGVSFTLRPGELTAILGPNGSGKSTLLRLLLGAIRPSRGRVELDGEPVHALHGEALASRVAYIAQRAATAEVLTVRQTVALGRFTLPASPEAIDRALDEFELVEHQHWPVGRLSAGQQQRVALARVAAQLWPITGAGAPRIILADEPASNLDPLFSARVLGAMASWAEAGACVAVVIHDLTAAARFADRTLVLARGGTIAADGHPDRALQPDGLARVFGVGFDRVESPGGPALVARVDRARPPTV